MQLLPNSHEQKSQRKVKIAVLIAYVEREPFKEVRTKIESKIRRVYANDDVDVIFVTGRKMNATQIFLRDKLENLRWGKYFWILRLFDYIILSTYKFKIAKAFLRENEIHVDVPDDIRHLLPKLLSAYELIQEDYDWIIRTTLHSVLNTSKLKPILELENSDLPLCGGRIIRQHDGSSFISGSFFVASKYCLKVIIDSKSKIDFSLIDDVSISRLLYRLPVKILELESTDVGNTEEVKKLTKEHLDSVLHYRCRSLEKSSQDVKTLECVISMFSKTYN